MRIAQARRQADKQSIGLLGKGTGMSAGKRGLAARQGVNACMADSLVKASRHPGLFTSSLYLFTKLSPCMLPLCPALTCASSSSLLYAHTLWIPKGRA